MTDSYNSLREVIHSKYIVDNTILEEPNVMKVQINGKPRDAECTLYRIDPNNGDPFPFFRNKENGGPKGLKDICDYIMLVDYHDKLFILLIELKRQKDNHAKEQLEATKVFIDYIVASAIRVQMPIDNNCIIYRKIQLNKIIPKQRTQIGNPEYDENGYMDYPWHGFFLMVLLK